jgi:aspartate racemase
MKTIGIIGGMSPESTVSYYKTLNALTKAQRGGYASAKILLHSVNFAETHAAQIAGDWDGIGADLARAAAGLERAGADVILLATNTMHKCAAAIEAAISIPFLHIGEACAARLVADGRTRPILLGTAFTMEEDFYTSKLTAHGLTPIIPDADQRSDIHAIIFDELVHGITNDTSRARYIDIVANLTQHGADSVILGCTEIGMLLNTQNSPLPPYDTALIHCEAAIRFAFKEDV